MFPLSNSVFTAIHWSLDLMKISSRKGYKSVLIVPVIIKNPQL